MITDGQKLQLIAYMQEVIGGLEQVSKIRGILNTVLHSIAEDTSPAEVSAALESMPEFTELCERAHRLIQGFGGD